MKLSRTHKEWIVATLCISFAVAAYLCTAIILFVKGTP